MKIKTLQIKFKKLKMENSAYREGINSMLNSKDRKWAWELINSLIENEIIQKEISNEK